SLSRREARNLSGLSLTIPCHGKTSPPPRRARNRILPSTAFRLPASLPPPARSHWSFISATLTPSTRYSLIGCSMRLASRGAGSYVARISVQGNWLPSGDIYELRFWLRPGHERDQSCNAPAAARFADCCRAAAFERRLKTGGIDANKQKANIGDFRACG